MKKTLATLLCLSTLLLCTACSADAPQTTEPIVTTEATEPTKPGAEIFTDELKAKLDEVLEQNKYQGIVSLTCNGETVYQWVKGTNDLGESLNIESPMCIASNSKQFCAAAVLMLRDQGKLSLDDTLEKYFPEYTIGKDITLHDLLSMQSGIARDPVGLMENIEQYVDQTPEENMDAIKEWTFEQPLQFTPGTQFEYSNVNYNLLSCVVEQVSGQRYPDFVRQNIFEPLGMDHSFVIEDVKANPQCGITIENLATDGLMVGLAQGCGDIVATAGDVDLWMQALQSGKVVSMESFREMTTGHAAVYGYGLERGIRGGWGHNGYIGSYTSELYFNEEYGYQLFVATNKTTPYTPHVTGKTKEALLKTVFEAADAAVG